VGIKIRKNPELEGFDLVTDDESQSHDGDKAGEWIATVYDEGRAQLLARLLDRISDTSRGAGKLQRWAPNVHHGSPAMEEDDAGDCVLHKDVVALETMFGFLCASVQEIDAARQRVTSELEATRAALQKEKQQFAFLLKEQGELIQKQNVELEAARRQTEITVDHAIQAVDEVSRLKLEEVTGSED
jgi:hypothetical protein